MNVNKKDSTIFLINNLKIIKVFRDKDGEKEASVTDFIY